MLAMLLMLAGLGSVGWQRTRNFDWNTIKPVWWLLREADGASAPASKARQEFVRRFKTDGLSEAQSQRVIEHALRVQADPKAVWITPPVGWGDVVDAAWDAGALTNEQFTRYACNAFAATFFVEARPRVRVDQPVPFSMGIIEPRLSPRWRSNGRPDQVVFNCKIEPRTRFNEVNVGFPYKFPKISSLHGGGGTRPRLDLQLPVGRHEVTLEFEFVVVQTTAGDTYFLPQDSQANQIVGGLKRWTESRTVAIEVVPADQPTVRLVPDESLRSRIVAALPPEFVRDVVQVGRTPYRGLHGVILITSAPVNLSFDVFARTAEGEHKIGAIAATAGQRGSVRNPRLDIHPRDLSPNAAAFDLILRAGPDAAEQTLEILEAWDGEIVIEDVPLRETSP